MSEFTDPLGWLVQATPEQRHGFELGLIYADMLQGSYGPWIITDGPRHLIHQMARAMRCTAHIVYDTINTPVPMIAVTMTPIKPKLSIV